ncbi:MAG: protein-tyrosine phosphatase family protein [Myxococcota bacterium]
MSTASLFELSDAHAEGPLGLALRSVNLVIRDRAVTALVGPTGSGKSTMLRRMSGRPLSDGWSVAGRWSFRGRPLPKRDPLGGVAWAPQIRNAPAGEFRDPHARQSAWARLDAALLGGSVVLLDEPTRGLNAGDREALTKRVRMKAEAGAAVVISHDLRFVRDVADDVCLLCDGEMVAQLSADDFFAGKGSALIRQFVEQGTCARDPEPPVLPRYFHWHIPQRLAGMGRPGLMRELDDDLMAIAYAGVTDLVSLTEVPLPTSRLRPFGLAGRHFPIADMGIPGLGETLSLCHDLRRAMDRGRVVAVHCRAGLGRTGLIIASLAVCGGIGAAEAIAQARRIAPGSIQTQEQADFVVQMEARR